MKPLTQLRRLFPSTPSKAAVYKLTSICSTQPQGPTSGFKTNLSWFSHADTQVYIPVLSLTREPALVQHVHRHFSDLIHLTTAVTKIKNKADEFCHSFSTISALCWIEVTTYLPPLHTLPTALPAQEVTNPKAISQLVINISPSEVSASSDITVKLFFEHFLNCFSQNELGEPRLLTWTAEVTCPITTEIGGNIQGQLCQQIWQGLYCGTAGFGPATALIRLQETRIQMRWGQIYQNIYTSVQERWLRRDTITHYAMLNDKEKKTIIFYSHSNTAASNQN